jgi:VWFA-related protein
MKAFVDEKAGTGPEFTTMLTTDTQRATEKLEVDTMVRNDSADSGVDALRDYQRQDATRVTEERVGATLLAFQQLARYLSPFTGRKNLIWISGSFPVNFSPQDSPRRKNAGPKHQYQRNIQATADRLAENQVAVYPIGAGGLAMNDTYNVDNSGRSISENNTEFSSNQTVMENLAADTGGKAYRNMNNLAEAASRAVDHGSRYYSLAYTPTRAEMDGKYRQIQVKVVSGNYKLVYRRGYYADDPAMPQETDQRATNDPLLPLLSFGMPDFSQVVYNIHVEPVVPQPAPDSVRAGVNPYRKQRVTRYRVDFAMSAQSITLEKNVDGMLHGSIEVRLIAFDNAGKPVNLVGKKIPILLQPKTYESVLQSGGFQFHEDIDLPSGEFYLRTGIYDQTSTHAGTLGFPLKVVTPN